MKKIISGFLAIVMMFSVGTVAFAGNTSAPASYTRDGVIATSVQIHKNEANLNNLRKSVITSLTAVRLKIAFLKKNGTILTQAQIDSLKTAISSLQDAKQTLVKNHAGKIAAIYVDLRQARAAKNYAQIKVDFDAILAEQASRATDLMKVLDAIKIMKINSL